MAIGKQPTVGLDIGTSAVRAAVVTTGRGGRSVLTSFGQVPLPPGAVVDGEIQDHGAVSDAISQLWKRAKLRSKRAVLGVSNQRVIVRQVDLPYLEEKEFRSSLRFQVADQIPMTVEDAELDFQVLEEYEAENQERMMRVLLIAAATDMVERFVTTATDAGLEVAGVDLTPFAIARAVSAAGRGEVGLPGPEAIIDVGAGVTNIVIHVNGEPRFVRILLIGGDDVTTALADDLGLSFEEAEAVKLDAGRGVGTPEGQRVLDMQVDMLVNEIRGSIEYYSSTEDDAGPLASVVISGGGSLTEGLIPKLERVLMTDLERAAPMSQLGSQKSGLTDEQVAQVEPVAAAAIGLALGGDLR